MGRSKREGPCRKTGKRRDKQLQKRTAPALSQKVAKQQSLYAALGLLEQTGIEVFCFVTCFFFYCVVNGVPCKIGNLPSTQTAKAAKKPAKGKKKTTK
jgi:hypothetical protein